MKSFICYLLEKHEDFAKEEQSLSAFPELRQVYICILLILFSTSLCVILCSDWELLQYQQEKISQWSNLQKIKVTTECTWWVHRIQNLVLSFMGQVSWPKGLWNGYKTFLWEWGIPILAICAPSKHIPVQQQKP